jgi:hypothetical protein
MTLVFKDVSGGRRSLDGGGRGRERFCEAWEWKFMGMNG